MASRRIVLKIYILRLANVRLNTPEEASKSFEDLLIVVPNDNFVSTIYLTYISSRMEYIWPPNGYQRMIFEF